MRSLAHPPKLGHLQQKQWARHSLSCSKLSGELQTWGQEHSYWSPDFEIRANDFFCGNDFEMKPKPINILWPLHQCPGMSLAAV